MMMIILRSGLSSCDNKDVDYDNDDNDYYDIDDDGSEKDTAGDNDNYNVKIKNATELYQLVEVDDLLVQVIMSRLNSMFELATQEEVDKLGQSDVSPEIDGYIDRLKIDR